MQKKNELEIVNFIPAYRQHFYALNKVWIEKYFQMEPLDEKILNDPESSILAKGGMILFAKLGEVIIGTVALKYVDGKTFELTKLGVDENYQGIGAGKLLCIAAIDRARNAGAGLIVLSTESRLTAAISIYRKLGFKEIPLVHNEYKRVDLMMELIL